MAESYLEFYERNWMGMARETSDPIEGTCCSMCPKEEVELRVKENLVHILEVVGEELKLVKRYSRPAADTNLAVAANLRTFETLESTVKYLLFEVTKRTDVSQLVIYNFVTDRLRAVRQDMIIQDLFPKLKFYLLEPMIRFHTYYGYLLCEESLQDYSPTLNRNFLLECLKSCLHSYDELEKRKTGDLKSLANCLLLCSLDKGPGLDRGLMEAIYVLTTLYDGSPMWRLHQMNDKIKCQPIVQQAYKIAVASLQNNFIRVCRAMDNLCPLLFCAVALFLPRIQRSALQIINKAYRSKVQTVPLDALCEWLRLGDEETASATLRHYGLQLVDGHLTCRRAAFIHNAPLLAPKKLHNNMEHLEGKMNLDYILTYMPIRK